MAPKSVLWFRLRRARGEGEDIGRMGIWVWKDWVKGSCSPEAGHVIAEEASFCWGLPLSTSYHTSKCHLVR